MHEHFSICNVSGMRVTDNQYGDSQNKQGWRQALPWWLNVPKEELQELDKKALHWVESSWMLATDGIYEHPESLGIHNQVIQQTGHVWQFLCLFLMFKKLIKKERFKTKLWSFPISVVSIIVLWAFVLWAFVTWAFVGVPGGNVGIFCILLEALLSPKMNRISPWEIRVTFPLESQRRQSCVSPLSNS